MTLIKKTYYKRLLGINTKEAQRVSGTCLRSDFYVLYSPPTPGAAEPSAPSRAPSPAPGLSLEGNEGSEHQGRGAWRSLGFPRTPFSLI